MNGLLRQYPSVLALLKLRGLEVGQYCNSEDTAAKMGEVIYTDLHEDVKEKLKKDSPISLIIGKESNLNER